MGGIPVSNGSPEENKKTYDNIKLVSEEYVEVEVCAADRSKIVRNAEMTECAFAAVCDSIGVQRSYNNKLKEKVAIRRQNTFGMSEEPYTNSIDMITMANLLECSLLIDEYKGGIWRRTVIKPMEEIAEKIRIPLIVVKNHVDGYRDSEMVTMKMNTSSGCTNCLSRRLRYRKGRLMAKGSLKKRH